MTFFYDCDINTVHKCVCSYVSRWKDYRWQRTNFDWSKTHAPFSEGAGIPKHIRRCRRFFKHQSICIAILFFKVSWGLGANWKIKSSILQESVLGRLEKCSELKVLWYFSRIMEATSSTACDSGLIKRVHVCWGPALSFFYCADLCYFNI